MMRRPCYGVSDAVDQTHHPNGSPPIQMSPPSRERARNCPIARPPRRSSPQEDEESEKGGNHARKRINVACARCRKRKIKCSGDLGTGVCLNCKNAGSDTCQFLRVNSTETSLADAWTYTHSGLPNPVYRNGLGPYASMAASTPYPGSMPSINGFPNATYPYGARQSYASAYSTSLPDDMFQGYSLQQPSAYHPSTTRDSSLPSLDYLSPEVSRHWPPVTATLGRPSHHSLSLDQESSHGRLTQPQSASVFGLSSLGNELPSFVSHRSRTLPMPDSQRTSVSHSSILSNENPLSGASQTFSYRSSIPWTEKGGNESNETSNSSTSSGVDPASSNASSSPHATQKSTSFGGHGLPSNSTSRELYYSPPSATTNIGLPSDEDQLDPENASLHGRLPRDHEVLNHQPTSSHYGYSLGSSTRAGASDHLVADGTLMNGQLYTRLEPQSSASYGDLPTISGGATNTYRPSLSSRSNARY